MLISLVLIPLLLGTTLSVWPHTLPGLRLGPASHGHEHPTARLLSALAAGGVALACVAILLLQAPAVFGGQSFITHIDWVPAIGLNLDFRLDGLSWLFAMLISSMGALIVLYGYYYLHHDDSIAKLYSMLMLFMAAMLGVVLSDNLLLLIVFWELTSVSSFLLVGYWGTNPAARRGARMALTITGGGGLAMLGGFLLLWQIAGTAQISALPALAAQIQADPLFPWALGLILLGCFTKSAQWPFHFWLPNAMAAPTPVSAYLHSATMVKAGIFLLLRLFPVLGGAEAFHTVVTTVGLLTVLFAAAVALFQHDLKGLLAYSTISHLGLIVFLIGIGSPLAVAAAVLHILNHAAFKAALFMTAGIVDHQAGTRDMRQLGCMYRFLPITAMAALIATAAMAGVPLLNGFISKEMFLTEAVQASRHMGAGWWIAAAVGLAATCSVAYSARFAYDTFFKPAAPEFAEAAAHNPHLVEPSWGMRLPVLLLAAMCVAGGLLPQALLGGLVLLGSTAALGHNPAGLHLALWHGWNLPLLISLAAMLLGGLGYAWLERKDRVHTIESDQFWGQWSGQRQFARAIDRLFGFAGRFTALTENGSLQRYVALLLLAAVAAVAWPLLQHPAARPGTGGRALLPANGLAWVVWGMVLTGCLAVLRWHRQRLASVVFTGVVGLSVALVFVAFSSPDLALTQISVEIVSTVLLLMGLALLPQTSPRESSPQRRLRDAALAGALGVAVAWLAWVMLTRNHDSISWFLLQNALPKGGGGNVVNVILVDFRGYDTMGEITVLAIAGMGVLALMEGLRVRRPPFDVDNRPWSFARQSLMLRVAATMLLPMALVVSLYIFMRGHNLPGGGFIAGLVTAVALVLQFQARGQHATEVRLHCQGDARFSRTIAAGLGAALCTGAGAMLLGYPFLTSASPHPVLPGLGELPLASAALFDVGVYLVVIGAVMLTLAVLGRASREAPAPAAAGEKAA